MARIAFLGGTGPHGLALALRFALAGEDVTIGSRRLERAQQAAQRIREQAGTVLPDGRVRAAENAEAARASDVVALTVPFAALEPLIGSVGSMLAGKIILDVVNPVALEGGVFKLVSVATGSVGRLIQSLVPTATVVSGFKNISAHQLWQARRLQGDVLVCGDTAAAKGFFIDLIARIPDLRAVDAGPLVNAVYLESITALLLNLNRQHKAITSIHILGL